MDFFAMKRKKLQSYCKKHGIPANLKNIEMAKQLSLIYQGKENQNPAPPQLHSIIDLDSDSGADDVQMEALDTVAGNDSNEKTNLSNEHKLEEESDQLSEVKSDHNVDSGSVVGNADAYEVNSASSQKTNHDREESKLNSPSEGDDIGSVNIQESMQMSVNKEKNEDSQELHLASSSEDANMVDIEHELLSQQADVDEDTSETEKVGEEAEKLDEEPDQILTTPLSEVKSDYKVDSGTADEKADAREVKSASSRKISQGLEESRLKSPSEGDDIGSVNLEENMQMSVDKEKNEDNQELDRAPESEDANMVDVERESLSEQTDVDEDTSETEKFGDEAEKLDEEPDQILTTPPSEIKSDPKVDSGTADGNADDHEVKSASSQKTSQDLEESKLKSSPEGDDIGSLYLEETLQISDKEKNKDNQDVHHAAPSEDENMVEGEADILSDKTDVRVDSSGTKQVEDKKLDQINIHQGSVMENVNSLDVSSKESSGRSVEQVQNLDDNNGAMDEPAAMCFDASTCVENTNDNTNVAGQDTLDEVHSSSFEDSDGAPVQVLPTDPNEVEMSNLDVHELNVTGTATKNADTNGVNFESSQKMSTSEKLIGSSTKLLSNSVTPRDIGVCDVEENIQIGVNQEQDDHDQEKTMDFSPTMLSNRGTPASDSEESMQVDANKENIDPGEGWNAEPSAVDMNDDDDDAFCFPDESIVAKNNESMQKNSYEGNSSRVQYSDGTHDLLLTTGELISSSTYPMAALDACEEEMLRSSEKACTVADPDFDASANKDFEAETCFDPNTLGDVIMETCNMNEIMQIDTMEKENSRGDCMNFFENSDVHDGIVGVGAEEQNQPDTVSRKRKRIDANSDEEVQDELVPTVPQTNEMELSNFRLKQLFASDTASGDEDAYPKKLDSPSKATPMIHKENIKFDKKDEVGSVMSRSKFAKRQPLQDLKQN